MPSSLSIRKIGLTGGIGSGKSTVGKILEKRRGFALIDADAISRSLTAPSGQAIGAIRSEFGEEFIKVDQSLNRDKMRQLVFNDALSKKRLEAIIHPLVMEEIEHQLTEAIQKGFDTALIDIPLLAESHARWHTRLDRILVIDCLPETQIKRVMQRNGLDRNSVMRILESQAKRELRNSLADWIIFNDELSQEELESRVLAIDFKI